MQPPIYSTSHLQQLLFTINVDHRDIVRIQNLAKILPCSSIIFYSYSNNTPLLQHTARVLTPLLQTLGCAVLIAESSQIAAEVQADGCYFEQPAPEIIQAYKQKEPNKIIGVGNIKSRHQAMEYGEKLPDFLLFGALNKDKAPSPLIRNLNLASWWARIMEIPCVIQGGASIANIKSAIDTKAEFLALEEAVFAEDFEQVGYKTLLKELHI